LPAALGLLLLREPIIRMIFERGEFNATSTRLTVWALGFFALGLIGHAVVEITVRAFYALKDTKTPVAIGVISMVINIILSLLLMHLFDRLNWPPHGGLALANSIAVTLEMIILLRLLRRVMGGLAETSLGLPIAKLCLATAGMALFLVGVNFFLPAVNPWMGGIFGIAGGGFVYIALAALIGVDELKPFQKKAVDLLALILARLPRRT
jgi:putative peptidoglycan lipid II flippase